MGPEPKKIIENFIHLVKSERHQPAKRAVNSATQPHKKRARLDVESGTIAGRPQAGPNTLSHGQRELLKRSLTTNPNSAVAKNPDDGIFHCDPCTLNWLLYRGHVQVAKCLLETYILKGIKLKQQHLNTALICLITLVDRDRFHTESAYKDFFLRLLVMNVDVNACDPDGFSALALCNKVLPNIPSFITETLTTFGAKIIKPAPVSSFLHPSLADMDIPSEDRQTIAPLQYQVLSHDPSTIYIDSPRP